MKNILLILLLFPIFGTLNAQNQITFKNNALRVDDRFEIKETEPIFVGKSGANVVWDYSTIKYDKTKTNFLVNPDYKYLSNEFNEANLQIEDGQSKYFYNISENRNLFLGFVTENSVIKYNNPIVKIEYPFDYKQITETKYTGTGTYYGTVFTNIWGSYRAEADAFGSIIFPDNILLNNIIRLKTEEHSFEAGCRLYEFFTKKYLYYSKDYRYPVFVITEINKIDEKDTVKTISTYYNELSVKQLSGSDEITNSSKIQYKIFPNPFKDEFNISYNLKTTTNVTIEIIDTKGALLDIIVENRIQNGFQSYNYKPKGATSGTIFVKLTFNGIENIEKLIKIDN